VFIGFNSLHNSKKENFVKTPEHITVYVNSITLKDGALKISERIKEETRSREKESWKLVSFQVFADGTVLAFRRDD